MNDKETILNQIRASFQTQKDFDSFLNTTVQFEGRDWTYGQFLYKHCYDGVQNLLFTARDNPSTLSQKELDLAQKGKFLLDNRMCSPDAVHKKDVIEQANLWNGNTEKETFYRNLFANPNRSTPNNPCHWPPWSQYQFLVIENELSKYGMNPEQIQSLMVHCEKEREKTEKFYQEHKPEQFVHNSPVPPEKMGGEIKANLRSLNNFTSTQKYCFVAEPNSFHSELPIQGDNWWVSWPRFKPKVSAFRMTEDEFKEKTKNGSYNYMIDKAQNDSIHPNIPLWGGAPFEWVSTESLHYTDVQKETVQDLQKQGMKLYVIPDKEIWEKTQGKMNCTEQEALVLLEQMRQKGEAIAYQENAGTQKGKGLLASLTEASHKGEYAPQNKKLKSTQQETRPLLQHKEKQQYEY